MGASVSKSSTEIVNAVIVNAVIEAAQEVGAGLSSTQTNTISGFSFFSLNKQSSTVSVAALQQVTIDAKLLDQITQDIKNAAKAEGAMLNPAVANSDVKIKNIVQSKFTNTSLQNCVAFVKSEQTNTVLKGGLSFGNVNLQTSEVLASCKVLQGISSDIARELFTETDQNAKSASKGLLDSMLGSNSLMYIVVFVVFIVVAGMIYSIFNKPVSNGTQNLNPSNPVYRNPGNPYPNNISAYGYPGNPGHPEFDNPGNAAPVSNEPIDFRSYDPNNPPFPVNDAPSTYNNPPSAYNSPSRNPVRAYNNNPRNPFGKIGRNANQSNNPNYYGRR